MYHPTPQEHETHRNDGYRALGRYIESFSVLVQEMRRSLESLIAPRPQSSDTVVVSAIVFAEMSAMQIGHAFFSAALALMDHDDAERKAAAALRLNVEDAIRERNVVAHGDWVVGALTYVGGTPGATLVPPTVLRTRTDQRDGKLEAREVDLGAAADELQRLTRLVMWYGRLIYGPKFPPPFPTRVHEVLRFTGSGNKRKAALVPGLPGESDDC